MPHGCSIWPALWSANLNTWPKGSEIDIIGKLLFFAERIISNLDHDDVEGVNKNTQDQVTIHTGDTCTLVPDQPVQSTLISTQCETIGGDNDGCAYRVNDLDSYGKGFNDLAGGVYAWKWEDAGISVWFFPRPTIPQDISDFQPDPSSWGEPVATFPNDPECDIANIFYDHQIVFDITFCGDWAGADYPNSGCPGTCAEAVANPKNFGSKFLIFHIFC